MTDTGITARRSRSSKPRSKRPNGGALQLPSGRWQARVTISQKRHALGTYDTRQAAEDAIAQTLLDHRRGNLADLTAGKTPFGTLAEDWFRTTATINTRERTVAEYRRIYNQRLEPTFGRLGVGEITGPLIREWAMKLTTEGLSGRTIARYITVLSGVLNEAVARGLIPASPLRSVQLSKVTRRTDNDKPHALAPDQLNALCNALRAEQNRRADERSKLLRGPAHPGHDVALMVRTMVLVGAQRKGEAEALLVSDLDTAAWRLSINKSIAGGLAGPPKTRAGIRTVPVPASLRDALSAHVQGRAGREPLWTSADGHRMNLDNFRGRSWCRALRTAGLPPMRIHDLRHTGVSMLLQAGIPVTVVAKAVGHADPSVTLSVYGHAIPGSLDQAAAALDGLVTGSVVSLHRGVA